MFDRNLQSGLQPVLQGFGKFVIRYVTSNANYITATGLLCGIGAMFLVATGFYIAGIGLIAINRILDGLDGAVARLTQPTDWGGYFDIVADFLFYSGIVFAFAVSQPEQALAAAFLIFSFVGTGSSFLAYAIFAAKRGQKQDQQRKKAFYYLGGLTEGFETIVALLIPCFYPPAFIWVCWIFGAMCWLTTCTRIFMAWQDFHEA